MEYLSKFFGKCGKVFSKQIDTMTKGILQCGRASTGLIAQSISVIKKIDFHTADAYVYRFFKANTFQIDDRFWRCHVNMLFCLLKEKMGLKPGQNIQINVDYTTMNNDFLILMASVNVGGEKDICLYFTTRKYPIKKDQISLSKMELAFFNGLIHVLSKKYSYTIVADRGFGNGRIVQICEKLGLKYAIRVQDNLRIKTQDANIKKLQDLQGLTGDYDVYVEAWEKRVKFVVNTNGKQSWYIATNLEDIDVVDVYEQRFKIEKLFQDIKSSGYDIEKTLIRKYDRVRRMLYLVVLGHAITTFLGQFVKNVKKNFSNHWALAKAFSDSVS
jgi:hypothetical protein